MSRWLVRGSDGRLKIRSTPPNMPEETGMAVTRIQPRPAPGPTRRRTTARANRGQVGPIASHVITGVGRGDLVTAIIVSFNTEALTKQTVQTLQQAYPGLHIILIDNGSVDGSSQYVQAVGQDTRLHTVLNGKNIGHGPALHQGILMTDATYVLLLDSDCVVQKSGFIEAMLERFKADSKLYAVGWLRTVDRISGVPLEWYVNNPLPSQFCRYVHPSCALLDRQKYLELPPAFHHGAPMLHNMVGAVKVGYRLEDFRVREYVQHLIAGTRRRYGGQWDPGQRSPGEFKLSDRHPI